MTAIEKGDLENVAALLKEKPELAKLSESFSKRPAENHTALQCAARMGHQEIAELLLANHADVNGSGHSGFTPLYQAAENGHLEIVKLLLARGADPNAETADGYTPLHLAASDGSTEIISLLLARGVDVNARTSSGRNGIPAAGAHSELAG